MLLMDVPEAEYLVFEHGPFDYEQENRSVEEKVEEAMAHFDFSETDYSYDTTPGRVIYFYHDRSSFMMVTLRPRASRMAAREAAAMPLPREDTTPPVTKI